MPENSCFSQTDLLLLERDTEGNLTSILAEHFEHRIGLLVRIQTFQKDGLHPVLLWGVGDVKGSSLTHFPVVRYLLAFYSSFLSPCLFYYKFWKPRARLFCWQQNLIKPGLLYVCLFGSCHTVMWGFYSIKPPRFLRLPKETAMSVSGRGAVSASNCGSCRSRA